MLESTTSNKDQPGTILWAPKAEDLNEITISKTDNQWFKSYISKFSATGLQYLSTLEWQYTEQRACQLISYFQEHLQVATEIEVWHIWVDDAENQPTVSKYSRQINDLVAADLEKLFIFGEYNCINIKNTR